MMEKTAITEFDMPDDLIACVAFHGHLCPGLVYGYLVAKAAIRLLDISRSDDEEVVAVPENDSCAVDALQVLLGTTAGKGNLIFKDYGKNAYTVLNRAAKRAYRFSRKDYYTYEGKDKREFQLLDDAISSGTATEQEKIRHKMMKSEDLLSKPFDEIFSTAAVTFEEPPFATLARSEACAVCKEMTMSTKMKRDKSGRKICMPCFESAAS